MRPGRPKAYSSGLRWVRVTERRKTVTRSEPEVTLMHDLNGDGIVTAEERWLSVWLNRILTAFVIIVLTLFVILGYYGDKMKKEQERELRLEKQMKSST